MAHQEGWRHGRDDVVRNGLLRKSIFGAPSKPFLPPPDVNFSWPDLSSPCCRAASLGWEKLAVRQTVRNCKLIKKTPTIPCRGTIEAGILVGMTLALDMLLSVLIGKPRIKGEDHIRFDSIQKIQGTFTTAWESYPRGIQEGSSISSGLKKHLSCNVPLNRSGLAYS